jgi:cytochrome P450
MRAPGPSTLQFILGTRKHGFLEYIGRCWRAYGDVFQVRIGSTPILFAMHPDAVDQVTVSGRAKYDKTLSFEPVRKYLTGDGLVSSRGDLWRRQRKLMAPFFTPKAIRSFSDVMISDALQMEERWHGLARQGTEVEIAEEMTQLTASIILKSVFGSSTMESIDEIRGAVETMIGFVTQRTQGFVPPDWLPTKKNRRYFAAQKLVHKSINGLIDQRRALPEAAWPDDLLSKMMKLRDPDTGEPMSASLLRDEAITLFFAGHETTARTMTFAWYALATHPHVTRKLHAELDRVLEGREPTVEDLRQLPYTLQVVKEVLRLHPPAPFYSRDNVELDHIGPYAVAPGTIILLSPYYTHRHPDFWKNPNDFDPERWTREAEANSPAFHPFGSGQRICIGNNFSLLESHILLATLARSFTPRLRREYKANWIMQGVLGLAEGLPMQIVARHPRHPTQHVA